MKSHENNNRSDFHTELLSMDCIRYIMLAINRSNSWFDCSIGVITFLISWTLSREAIITPLEYIMQLDWDIFF